jgi:hypothetical protein
MTELDWIKIILFSDAMKPFINELKVTWRARWHKLHPNYRMNFLHGQLTRSHSFLRLNLRTDIKIVTGVVILSSVQYSTTLHDWIIRSDE